MKFTIDVGSRNTLVPLVLRLGLAFIFIYSGLHKITAPGTGWGSSWIPDAPDFIKPLPAPVQLAVAWGELAGGIALGLGLLTRLAALGVAGIMVGTIYWLTGAQGFKSGWDYNFAVIVMCVALMISGGGTLARRSGYSDKTKDISEKRLNAFVGWVESSEPTFE